MIWQLFVFENEIWNLDKLSYHSPNVTGLQKDLFEVNDYYYDHETNFD